MTRSCTCDLARVSRAGRGCCARRAEGESGEHGREDPTVDGNAGGSLGEVRELEGPRSRRFLNGHQPDPSNARTASMWRRRLRNRYRLPSSGSRPIRRTCPASASKLPRRSTGSRGTNTRVLGGTLSTRRPPRGPAAGAGHRSRPGPRRRTGPHRTARDALAAAAGTSSTSRSSAGERRRARQTRHMFSERASIPLLRANSARDRPLRSASASNSAASSASAGPWAPPAVRSPSAGPSSHVVRRVQGGGRTASHAGHVERGERFAHPQAHW
jgi:hypothetical protein